MKTISTSGRRPNNKKQKAKKQCQYSPQKVENALVAHRAGMPLKRVSEMFGVPRSTLWNKIHNRAPLQSSHPGPVSLLPREVEVYLKDYIIQLARKGFPLNREAVLDSVKVIVETMKLENLPFTENRPGRKWFEKFLTRFPEISVKNAENLTKARALVTEQSIRNWFEDIQEDLRNDNVDMSFLEDPQRVWNTDETAMFLAPKGSKILGPRGENVYDVTSSSDKDCLTVLFTVNAAGEMAPPLALFPYVRIPAEIARNAPCDWGLGRTEKGWMTGPAFYEYVANVFLPFIKKQNIPFPIGIFMDGHKSHITKDLSELCQSENIVLIALPPNATAIMQPLDVSVFRPLKNSWSKIVKKWRMNHNGEEITKVTFCTAVNEAIQENDLKKAIISGFRATGLYPFSADKVDYTKCVKKHNTTVHNNQDANTPLPINKIACLDYIEGKIEPFLLEQFIATGTDEWKGDIKATCLFKFWREVKHDREHENNAVPLENNKTLNIKVSIPVEKSSSELTESASHNTDAEQNIRPHTSTETTDSVETSKDQDSMTPAKITIDPSQPSTSSNHQPVQFQEISKPRTPSVADTSDTISHIFKEVLFSPTLPKKKSKRRGEKAPSVITGKLWNNYHDEKVRLKLEKERLKEERKNQRLQKTEEKKNDLQKQKKRRIIECSDESSDGSLHYQSSGESVLNDSDDENTTISDPSNLKEGAFVLVEFKGGPRLATKYHYVCVIQSVPSGIDMDDDIRVMALNCLDESKKMFALQDDDISFVQHIQIVGVLPAPQIVMQGTRMRYVFEKPVKEVFQKS